MYKALSWLASLCLLVVWRDILFCLWPVKVLTSCHYHLEIYAKNVFSSFAMKQQFSSICLYRTLWTDLAPAIFIPEQNVLLKELLQLWGSVWLLVGENLEDLRLEKGALVEDVWGDICSLSKELASSSTAQLIHSKHLFRVSNYYPVRSVMHCMVDFSCFNFFLYVGTSCTML